MVESANDNDNAAYQLLGWSSSSATTNNNATIVDNNNNNEEEEEWNKLHSTIRCTGEDGVIQFRNAMSLLAGNDGRIIFATPDQDYDVAPTNNQQQRATNNSGSLQEQQQYKDPMTIIKSYFRLIKCSLEVPQINNKNNMTSKSSLSEDEWVKLASELLKRMTESLKNAMMEQYQMNPTSSTSTTAVATSASQTSMNNINNINKKCQSQTTIVVQQISKVTYHYLYEIITNIHPYLKNHIRLLGPTYRNLCDVSSLYISILQNEKLVLEDVLVTLLPIVAANANGRDGSRSFKGKEGFSITTISILTKDIKQLQKVWKESNTLLEQGALCLLKFLDGVLNIMELPLLFANNESSSSSMDKGEKNRTSTSLSPEKQSKIVIFLLARITSLVLLSMKYDTSFGTNDDDEAVMALLLGRATGSKSHEKNNSNDEQQVVVEGKKKLMTGFLQRLVRVRSLSLVAKGRLNKEKVQNSSVNQEEGRHIAALLGTISGLGPKVEQYLNKILGDLDPSKDNNNGHVICLGLECFVDLHPSLSCCEEEESGENIMMKDTSLAKIVLMKYVLMKLVAQSGKGKAGLLTLPEPNSMNDFYQSLMFVDVPRCHHFFFQATSSTTDLQSQARDILSDLVCVLEHASHLLCRRSRGNCNGGTSADWQQTLAQQHHLLVRWLAAPATSSSSSTSSPNHPMANEMLLQVLQRRVLTSCAADDSYSRQDSTHLISLLSQLLFHPRTETSHRRNIATLLIRLLSMPIRTKKTTTDATSLTILSLWSNMKKYNIINATPRQSKRKRTKDKSMSARKPSSALPPDDIYTICRVLEALAKSSVLSRRGVDAEVSVDMRQMWKSLLSFVDNKRLTRSEDIDGAMFLWSLSTGAVRASADLSKFYATFDKDGAVFKDVQGKTLMESVLAFVELQFGNKSSSSNSSLLTGSSAATRKELMHLVCIEFVGALSECIGGDLLETHIKRIGMILKRATVSPSSANATSVQSFGLRYGAVSTASKMGNIIRSDFGESSLKVCFFIHSLLYSPTYSYQN